MKCEFYFDTSVTEASTVKLGPTLICEPRVECT